MLGHHAINQHTDSAFQNTTSEHEKRNKKNCNVIWRSDRQGTIAFASCFSTSHSHPFGRYTFENVSYIMEEKTKALSAPRYRKSIWSVVMVRNHSTKQIISRLKKKKKRKKNEKKREFTRKTIVFSPLKTHTIRMKEKKLFYYILFKSLHSFSFFFIIIVFIISFTFALFLFLIVLFEFNGL